MRGGMFEEAEWMDGSVTAGHQPVQVTDNLRLPEDPTATCELGAMIAGTRQQNERFLSAALPARIFLAVFWPG